MARVTELYVRADWGLIRFAYLPLIIAGLTAARFLPWVWAVMLRAAPCAICLLLARWANHAEESLGSRPILQVTDRGIIHEDGGDPTEYGWSEITGVVMHRREETATLAPPYWLAIAVRDPDYRPDDGDLFEEGEGYAQRSRRPEGEREVDTTGERLITVWPRQVEGGLFSLMRFAKELQGQLIYRADQGEIPRLLPEGQ